MAQIRPASSTARLIDALVAVGLPWALTGILLWAGGGQGRDYAFLYLGLVAALALTRGLGSAILAATASFLLVDWFFVPPIHAFTIADEQDLVNLVVFFGAAGLIGGLGSRQRQSQLQAEALARDLRTANVELARLNREQAEAASVAVRLARTEQQVRLLAESDRVRREFLATVSHELRTPLAGILTLSTAMTVRPRVSPAIREDLESIAEQARRLNRLVSDMLDMARIEGNTLDLHLDAVDLGAAVEAAVDRLHQTAPSRAVDVEVASDTLVIADWDRLGQILDNLVGNAERFAPPGTAITVRAGRGAREMMVLRVADQGPGIPVDLRERIFERFVRGPVQSDGGTGTGLGLAIVKGLVEAHAGRVWVDDPEDGVGTVMAVALPAAPDA
jgi:K+-sensing histidine kinase KdpD